MKEKNIILIGGAPTVGKSTVAALVAKHFDLPWISTDQIREIMRRVAKREDAPKLFNPEGYTGERFLTEFSSEEIVQMEIEQGEAVWPVVKDFILDDHTWKEGFIIEGVNILPYLVSGDFKDNKSIKTIFLIDEDADRMREVIYNRGLWDDAKKYSDDVKEKEVEWASLFSHKLKAEAEKYGYPVVEVKKGVSDLETILRVLGEGVLSNTKRP